MERLAIDGEGIRKAYQSGSVSTPVLTGVELRIPIGECVFLAGPSGSGKSTLLSVLGCILTPDEGQVRILGEDVTRFGPKDQARFRRRRIGFVFQRFHLIRALKAWENVAVALNLLGEAASSAKKESHRLLEAVGLAEKASSPISQLSLGQQQRVALARALAGDPELILADEPTAALDAAAGLAAMTLLRDLTTRRGKTAFVVTHDPRIFSMADRILHLEDGRIGRITTGAESSSRDGATAATQSYTTPTVRT